MIVVRTSGRGCCSHSVHGMVHPLAKGLSPVRERSGREMIHSVPGILPLSGWRLKNHERLVWHGIHGNTPDLCHLCKGSKSVVRLGDCYGATEEFASFTSTIRFRVSLRKKPSSPGVIVRRGISRLGFSFLKGIKCPLRASLSLGISPGSWTLHSTFIILFHHASSASHLFTVYCLLFTLHSSSPGRTNLILRPGASQCSSSGCSL